MGVFWLTSREESRPIHCIVIVFVPNAHCSSSRFCCVTCAFCVSSLSRLCVERRDDQLVWLPAPHAAAYTRPSPPRPSDIQPFAIGDAKQTVAPSCRLAIVAHLIRQPARRATEYIRILCFAREAATVVAVPPARLTSAFIVEIKQTCETKTLHGPTALHSFKFSVNCAACTDGHPSSSAHHDECEKLIHAPFDTANHQWVNWTGASDYIHHQKISVNIRYHKFHLVSRRILRSARSSLTGALSEISTTVQKT